MLALVPISANQVPIVLPFGICTCGVSLDGPRRSLDARGTDEPGRRWAGARRSLDARGTDGWEFPEVVRAPVPTSHRQGVLAATEGLPTKKYPV
jgi:hypothetical protein